LCNGTSLTLTLNLKWMDIICSDDKANHMTGKTLKLGYLSKIRIYIYDFHLSDFPLFSCGLGNVGQGRVIEGRITLCYIDPINLGSSTPPPPPPLFSDLKHVK
jgi:hypothetical protein